MEPLKPDAIIEVFSEEQLNVLPQKTKDVVVFLGEKLPAQQLVALNPMVKLLLEVKALENIKFVAKPADGENLSDEEKESRLELHAQSIEQFKEAKKKISSFKTTATETKSAMKRPIDELGKKVLEIETSVKDIAENVMKSLEKTFEPYLTEKKAKEDAAKAKRDAKATAATTALSNEVGTANATIAKSKIVTFLKYEMLEPVEKETNEAIDKYSLEKLIEFQTEFPNKYTFAKLSAGQDKEAMAAIPLDEFDIIVSLVNGKLNILQESIKRRVEHMQTLENTKSAAPAAAAPAAQPIDVIAQANSGKPYGSGLEKEIFPSDMDANDLIDFVNNVLIATRLRFINAYNTYHNRIPAGAASESDVAALKKVHGSIILVEKIMNYVKPPEQPQS